MQLLKIVHQIEDITTDVSINHILECIHNYRHVFYNLLQVYSPALGSTLVVSAV